MKIGEMHKFCENGEGDINFVEIEGKYAIASLALGMDSPCMQFQQAFRRSQSTMFHTITSDCNKLRIGNIPKSG